MRIIVNLIVSKKLKANRLKCLKKLIQKFGTFLTEIVFEILHYTKVR